MAKRKPPLARISFAIKKTHLFQVPNDDSRAVLEIRIYERGQKIKVEVSSINTGSTLNVEIKNQGHDACVFSKMGRMDMLRVLANLHYTNEKRLD